MKSGIWGLAICGLLATSAVQADDPVTVQAQRVETPAQVSIKASELMGAQLKDSQGNDLGKVEDMVLDLNNHEIDYLILSHGQQGDSWFAVPPAVIMAQRASDAQQANFVVNVPADKMQKAPTFTQDQWSVNGFNPNWVKTNQQFYQQYEYPNRMSRRMNRAVDRANGRLDRAEDRANRQLDRAEERIEE